jgi:elongation factor G
VSKLNVTVTGDTLGDRGMPILMPAVTYPEPLFSVSISPKTKADLDKLGSSLGRLVEEDPTLRVERNTETNEDHPLGDG